MKKAFTLIELLAVISIMGVLGTISVGGYRQMQRGIEERGAIQNVNQFIRDAYQRAQIDRQPVQVYFWNEIIRKETDFDPMIVVGRAVAVRYAGRISKVDGNYLIDEFGDLAAFRSVVDEDENKPVNDNDLQNDADMYLYNMADAASGQDQFARATVKQSVYFQRCSDESLIDSQTGVMDQTKHFPAYAFVIDREAKQEASDWSVGTPYGFEFAQIQLAHNYIFERDFPDPKNLKNPVSRPKVFTFLPGDTMAGDTIEVCSLRPDSSGELKAEPVAKTQSPSERYK